jgi:ABC-type dipeptide/oligopeptide/nickel transport system permease subunit
MNDRFVQRFARRSRRNPVTGIAAAILVLILFCALAGPWIAPHDPLKTNFLEISKPPSPQYIFGTDQLGRDVFSRVLHGARLSVSMALLSVALGLVAGGSLGLMAGFFGGRVDTLTMQLVDVLLAFPGILLAILIVSIFGSSYVNVVIALAFFSVPTFARIARSSALSIRNLDYVTAAHALGSGSSWILLRHVLPNALTPLIIYSTLRCASAILGGASLSFLGLGVAPPTPEWGLMIAQARESLRSAPHIIVFPGLAIFITVLAVNIVGDAVRDVLDPKLRI